jgi:ubiquitin carboxyl-terminal hydrolase 34
MLYTYMCRHGQPGSFNKTLFDRLTKSQCCRQCMCCYRDPKNLERFSYITQGLIYMVVCQLKQLAEKGSSTDKKKDKEENKEPSNNEKDNTETQDRDKLLILVSKVFLLNFPLYVAYKHTIQAKLDELTQQEMQNLNLFCDLHDSEIPIYLLKNVSWFCKMGGLLAMTACFTQLSPEHLPVSTAHAMISVGTSSTSLHCFLLRDYIHSSW